MNTRDKGDLAVLAVATDLMKRGFKVAIPFGDSWDYDLVVMKPAFKRLQVKYVKSDGAVVRVRCRTHSVAAGRVSKTKTYTAAMIDGVAVYDRTTDRCFYVPVRDVEGKEEMRFRLSPAKNGMQRGIVWAKKYEDMI